MIRIIITILILALISAVLGFGGIAAGIAGIAKALFYLLLGVFVAALLMKFVRRV
ncbi:DUF1328 family protein [Microscilla marina]|uniref:DUF1328 family protein n=1 Tax=Microscilla marina TaxID=1027 RepID=UPI0005D48384|nr:DUF1328 family protein [Microscilla marina]